MFKKSTAPAAAGGYTLSKSLRFRSGASAYLNRTPGTAGDRQKWTWSGWVKRGVLGATVQNFFSTNFVSSNTFEMRFDDGSPDQLKIAELNTTTAFSLVTTQVFRDPSAWYHIVFAVDTTQATSTNRLKLYVNGSQVTAFSSATYPAQNFSSQVNSTVAHYISSWANAGTPSRFFDGYLSNVQFVDGQQLTPTSFGSFSGTGGVWQPIAYTGTYGTNGFYLPFTNTTSTATLGNDSSGNSNTWTVNNISLTAGATYDSMTDVPTLTSATVANYCVWNPLFQNSEPNTYTNGNLNGSGTGAWGIGTMAIPSGKFYAEINYTTFASDGGWIGIQSMDDLVNDPFPLRTATGNVAYKNNGDKAINQTSSAYGATYVANDIIGIAVDIANNTITFYKNNTSQGAFSYTFSSSKNYVFAIGSGGTRRADVYVANFGQRPFTYTPPSGFVALNTYNLSTPTIAAGNKYMDATLYTGTLLSNSITNAGAFKPDLVWVKSRSAATVNKLTDSVRGVTKALVSSTDAAETTDTQGLTAFGSSGFTVGTNTDYNNLADTYVGWQWQAGQSSGSSNTNGSITSTVSASTTAGFSVVIYTGTGANATVGHGLSAAPQMVIAKNRSDAVSDWEIYNAYLTSAAYRIRLNNTAAQSVVPTIWNSTAPTSTVFSISTDTDVNASGKSYVAYCWTPIAGYSAFGSYTGNGSNDGPFVYTGFRPKFIMIKRTDAVTNWYINDSSRDPYNVVGQDLGPNLSTAESSDAPIQDFLSNGFKLRNGSYPGFNASSGTYIYAAFAENPFKYALAR